MKYIINNIKCVKDKNIQRSAKQVIKKQVNRLSRIAENYRKPVTVNVFFNRVDNINYQIATVVVLKEHVIYVDEKDSNIEAGIHKLFDKLKLSLAQKIHKEKKNYLLRRKKNRLKNIHENIRNLQDLRQESSKEIFKKFSKILLSDVSRYVKRRIRTMNMTTELTKSKFNIQEILDDLFLIIYDKFDEIPQEEEKITVWLYKKADELLAEKFKEFQFNEKKTVRLENILEGELKTFDEQFTINADEEIIPVEELDEFTPEKGEYPTVLHRLYLCLFSPLA